MALRDEAYLRHMLDAMDRVAEAAGRVTRELTGSRPEIPWAEITGLRHKVVHDYFVVDLQIVWQTATEDVPLVRPLIAKLLDDAI